MLPTGRSFLLELQSSLVCLPYSRQSLWKGKLLMQECCSLCRLKNDERIHSVKAKKIDYVESIVELKKRLESETDEIEKAWLELRLKADTRGGKLMKFVGASVEWYEPVRFWTTVIMILLSLIGIGMFATELLQVTEMPSVCN